MQTDSAEWEAMPSTRIWPGRLPEWPVSGVVQHYTAAGSGRALARWLAQGAAVKVSAHILICRDGHVIQQVRFADRAWHAGERMDRGLWRGQPQPTNVNHFTIGIENSNYGILGKDGDHFVTPYGKRYRGPEPVRLDNHRGEPRWWEPYTDEVVEANIRVLRRIAELYPAITRDDVQGHSDVSPHRKNDPGPAWPAQYVLDSVFGTAQEKPPLPAVAIEPEPDDVIEIAHRRGDLAAHYDDEAGMCVEDVT